MSQYPASSFSSKLLVTKTNTAGQKNLSTNAYDSIVVTANTSGGFFTSWVQYVASTAADLAITGLSVKVTSTGSADFPLIMQIGVGGAGAETNLCDIPVHGISPTATILPVFLPTPLRITSGSRIAVRAYAASSNGAAISCALFGVLYANLEGN